MPETGADPRSRMIAAMRELAATERGWRPVTVAQVVAHAGVSRKTLYEHFDSGEDLFGTVVESAFEELCASVERAAAEAPAAWEDRVVETVAAFFDALEADPHLAWLCAVEALGNDERARSARRAASERIGTLLAPPEPDPAVPAGTGAGVVRMLWELAYQQLTGADERPLRALAEPGVFLALSPYIDPAQALRLARRGR